MYFENLDLHKLGSVSATQNFLTASNLLSSITNKKHFLIIFIIIDELFAFATSTKYLSNCLCSTWKYNVCVNNGMFHHSLAILEGE